MNAVLWIFVLVVILAAMNLLLLILQTAQYYQALPTTGAIGPTGPGLPSGTVTYLPGPNVPGEYGIFSSLTGSALTTATGGVLDWRNQTIVLDKTYQFGTLIVGNSIVYTNGFRLFGSVLQSTGGVPSTFYNIGSTGTSNDTGTYSPGGAGGVANELGGGGTGGIGYARFTATGQAGGSLDNVYWNQDTTLFNGTDGVITDSTLAFGQGLGGVASSLRARSDYDLVQALNPTFVPVSPMLNGGCGGGGGQSTSTTIPGSGGGGGGGVMVVAVQSLFCDDSSPLTLDVSGGDAGDVLVEPETATSGAGGAGGLIILSTRSLRSLYSGLVVKFSGGLYVDALGSTRQSRSGMVVNYYNPTAYITAVNATQFCTLLTTSVLSQNVLDNIPTPVQLFNLTRNLGVQFNDTTNQITVSESGTYLVSVSIPTSSSAPGEFTCWLRRNNDTTTLYGQVTAQQIIALSTQINLDAGDTLMVMVYQNSGGTLTLNSSPSAPISLSLNHISFL